MRKCVTMLLAAVLVASAFAVAGHAKQRKAKPATVQDCMTAYQTCRSICFGSRGHGSCFAGCISRRNQCLNRAQANTKSK